MSISRTAFEAIVERLRARRADFADIAATGYSFEEWVTCEAFVACKQAWPDSAVSPRPHYSKVGSDLRAFGDLLVPRKLSRVLIEIGVIHAGTGWKWDRKIDNDSAKLASIADAQALQLVIVVAGERDPRKLLTELQERMSRFRFAPRYTGEIDLGQQVAHIYGWTDHSPGDES